MNEKSLGKEELEDLFNKFDNIENINQVLLGGSFKSYLNAKNPNLFTIKDSKNNTCNLLKGKIHIPSTVKKGFNQTPYISNISFIATGDLATESYNKFLNPEDDFPVIKGLFCNYTVDNESLNVATDEQVILLAEILRKNPEDEIIQNILQIFNFTYKTKNKLGLSGVIAEAIENRMDAKEVLLENNKLLEINKAHIQGLVYMPPSIRKTDLTNQYYLHFKVRVKRNCSLNIPYNFSNKVDIINVVYYGNEAVKYYENLKQGYPVNVTGRLESNKYKKTLRIEQNSISKLANLLKISSNHDLIDTILDILKIDMLNNKPITIPTLELLAENINTNFK